MKIATTFCVLGIALFGCSGTNNDIPLHERAGAPLFEGMGSYRMPITTEDADAQKYFNQGMVLSFAFNHAEAVRSFKAAQRLDPNCAMCFWGEALAIGPNINVTNKGKVVMSPADREKAFAAIQVASSLKSTVTEAERDLIDALSARYNGDISSNREPLDLAWADAMAAYTVKYPNDNTAAAIYAEALMNTMPWNYWSDDGIAKPETKKVINALENVLLLEPDHPLALHLYIHALEASNEPERAEDEADRLLELVPGAGHLVHMPSHIYYRIGRYQDAADSNMQAAAVDEAYIAACNAQGFYPAAYYPHNIHFLWASATMQGQSELSIESAQRVVENVNIEQVQAFPTIEFFRTVPLLSLVRFAKWEQILDYPQPFENFLFAKGIWHYARGVAFAAIGEQKSAENELAELIPLQSGPSVDFLDEHAYPATSLLEIASQLLKGEIAYRGGEYDSAIENFQKAVSIQDDLPYTEPPFWYYPTRQSLGAALLAKGLQKEAETVYLRDLEIYPKNGWSLFGLIKSYEAQGKVAEAELARQKFEVIWQNADVQLESSIL